MEWCIKNLLRNDLLNDQQKAILKDFLTNEVAVGEIADVLNLRFGDLENWSWETERGMFYKPRRQLNGKYRIMMDEEILQAIFLHFICVKWTVEMKAIFTTIVGNLRVWPAPCIDQIPGEEQRDLDFYLGSKMIQNGQGR